MKVSILKNNGKVSIWHHASSVEMAKASFQWRYGYWPTDKQVLKVEEDDPVK